MGNRDGVPPRKGYIKALTVAQPWASLIAIGAAPYHFSITRPPSYLIGKSVAIHAGAKPASIATVDAMIGILEGPRPASLCVFPAIALPFLRRLRLEQDGRGISLKPNAPIKHILGMGVIGQPKAAGDCAKDFVAPGSVIVIPAASGFRWGWPILNFEALPEPIPKQGRSGLWDWKPPT